MRNILIRATAVIHLTSLVLSMVVAKAGFPWLGIICSAVSLVWLSGYFKANFYEHENGASTDQMLAPKVKN